MYENQNSYNPYAQNIAIVKEYFKRPLVLVIGILYIVSIIISLISSVSMGANIGDMYSSLFEFSGVYSDMPAEDAQILSMFTNSGFISTFMIMCMIPSIIMIGLYVLAYFLMHFKSKNPDPNANPKGGVTILFVMSIISLVGVIFTTLIFALYAVLFVIMGIMFMTDPSMAADGGAVAGIIFIVLALFFVGFGALVLTFSISELTYINSIRKSLTTVKLYNKGAGVYGVFSIIYGGLGIFSAISTLFIGPMMSLMMNMVPSEELVDFPVQVFESMGSLYTISGIASLLSAVIMILCGVLALGYKKHINKYTNAYAGQQVEEAPMQSAPTYAQPSISQPAYTQSAYTQENTTNTQGACPQCGAACDENAIFCNNCGTRIK